jgi:hypothetical protein
MPTSRCRRNPAGLVHDSFEQAGWEIETAADTQSVKRLAPVACKTDKIDCHRAAARTVPIHTAPVRV